MTFSGSTVLSQRAKSGAAFIIYGVAKTVMTDTAIITGYMKSRSTPRDMPRVASMKANSPTWATLKPQITERSMPLPASRAPDAAKKEVPVSTARVIASTIPQCSAMTPGSSIIPTETKNMAPNRVLRPETSCIILSFSTVSDSIEPITNAPSADEKPTAVARATIAKQRPMLITSSISSLR